MITMANKSINKKRTPSNSTIIENIMDTLPHNLYYFEECGGTNEEKSSTEKSISSECKSISSLEEYKSDKPTDVFEYTLLYMLFFGFLSTPEPFFRTLD